MFLKSFYIRPELFDCDLLNFTCQHLTRLICIMNLLQLLIILKKVRGVRIRDINIGLPTQIYDVPQY